MNCKPYKKINFENLKEKLKINTFVGRWTEQPNGVRAMPLISEEESEKKDLTYISLIFSKQTDAHYYKTQTENILFLSRCGMTFYENYNDKYIMGLSSFKCGDAISIDPGVVRNIIPYENKPCGIELIVQPRFDIADEVHVFE